MTDVQNTQPIRSFLARLRNDTSGNVIALMAAAVVPTIGLVGGGLDMSRLYLVQTRLQAACDAGALMGRRVMGANPWDHNNYKARTEAERIFNMNFEDRAYGTKPVVRTFTEAGGNVSGTVKATVPMTLMRVLGSKEKEISVNCASEMRIPDSDVMFVLDTTGSMGQTSNGSQITSSNPSKIDGLQVATQCFYEVLTQQNIPEVSPEACGNTADPTVTDSNISTIRFGFVPYSINVNVGKLLPLDYIADNWEYQTRKPNFSYTTIYSHTYGTEGSRIQTSQTPNSSVGGFVNATQNYTQGNTTYLRTVSGSRGLNCANITLPANVITSNVGGIGQIEPYPATPVNPQSSIRRYYQQGAATSTTTRRYIPESSPVSRNRRCFLQQRTDTNSLATYFYADTPVTWTNIQKKVFNNWTYDKVSLNVSGLKDRGNNAWRSTVNLPLQGEDNASTAAEERGSNIPISWDGCILERETVREPSSWYPIPSDAKDMNIDMKPDPSDPSTQWGPRLLDVLYERRSINSDGTFGEQSVDAITTTKSDMPLGVRRNRYGQIENITQAACPSSSRIYQSWDPAAYRTYIESLSTAGYTFHDIGLLWGARLMSPTGIFGTHNGEGNDLLQRHMVFMTDGDTHANRDSKSAYNYPYYDRLQTDVSAPPSLDELNDITDERAAALCTSIKNMNVTLWVVSYGEGVSSDANSKLQSCASPGRFYVATSTAALTTNFKSIAAQISALRLTS